VAELKRLAAIGHHEFLKTDRWLPIVKAMRAKCPVPGDDWHRLLAVSLPVNDGIPEHSHPRKHTVLFYPEACDPVLIEGVPFHPDKGTMLYMKPGTNHSVPPVETERLTIAMLVKDA